VFDLSRQQERTFLRATELIARNDLRYARPVIALALLTATMANMSTVATCATITMMVTVVQGLELFVDRAW
jgi:hypothetical protein